MGRTKKIPVIRLIRVIRVIKYLLVLFKNICKDIPLTQFFYIAKLQFYCLGAFIDLHQRKNN